MAWHQNAITWANAANMYNFDEERKEGHLRETVKHIAREYVGCVVGRVIHMFCQVLFKS